MSEVAIPTRDGSSFSLVLCSGTDDKLAAASVLVVGAAAMGRTVDILLQYWALEAFRADAVRMDHGVSPEAGADGAALFRDQRAEHWSDLLRQAKEIGDVRIHACSLSMDLFGLEMPDLDPLVDDQEGVASFFAAADGAITFV